MPEGTSGSDCTHPLWCLNPYLTSLRRVSAWALPGIGNTLPPRVNHSTWTTPFDRRFFLMSNQTPASLYIPPTDCISDQPSRLRRTSLIHRTASNGSFLCLLSCQSSRLSFLCVSNHSSLSWLPFLSCC